MAGNTGLAITVFGLAICTFGVSLTILGTAPTASGNSSGLSYLAVFGPVISGLSLLVSLIGVVVTHEAEKKEKK